MSLFVRVGSMASRGFGRVVPEPFVVAVGLLLLVLTAAMLRSGDPLETLRVLGSARGMWGLSTFAMQMSLMLVLGSVLAEAPLVHAAIRRVASIPGSGRQLVAATAAVACVLAVLNWSLGLIGGALLAREAGREARRRGWDVPHPLLCAAGYSGLMVWHGGWSGSAPLKAVNPADLREVLGGELAARIGAIALSETLLSPLNLVVTGGLLVLAPLVFAALTPTRVPPLPGEAPKHATLQGGTSSAPPDDVDRDADDRDADDRDADDRDAASKLASSSGSMALGTRPQTSMPAQTAEALTHTPASLAAIERLRLFAWLPGLVLLAAFVASLRQLGFAAFDLDAVNLALFGSALLAHGRPDAFWRACERAVTSCAGVIVQFPLYAAIMGIMSHSGLSADLSRVMVENFGQWLLPITFLAAGALNVFVPSGGGQWAVQGPVMLSAALELEVAPGDVVMAIAYGDQWTNMIQPFWALPLLAITRVRARDIVGYAALWMLCGGLWIGGVLVWHARVPIGG